MYRVNSIMGDSVFQVLDWSGCVIRTFYTEQAAKEFADKLETEEFFAKRDHTIKLYLDGLEAGIRCALCTNPIKSDRGCDGGCKVNEDLYKRILDVIDSCTVK